MPKLLVQVEVKIYWSCAKCIQGITTMSRCFFNLYSIINIHDFVLSVDCWLQGFVSRDYYTQVTVACWMAKKRLLLWYRHFQTTTIIEPIQRIQSLIINIYFIIVLKFQIKLYSPSGGSLLWKKNVKTR